MRKELTPEIINRIGRRICCIANQYDYSLGGPYFGHAKTRIPELEAMRQRLFNLENEFIVERLRANYTDELDRIQAGFDQIVAEIEALNKTLESPRSPEVFGEMEEISRWPRLSRFGIVDDSVRYDYELILSDPKDW